MTVISIIHALRDEAFGAKVSFALSQRGHTAHCLNEAALEIGHPEQSQAAIVIWSNAAAKLTEIHNEARMALARGALIPIAVGGARPPADLETPAPVDLSGWDGDEADPRWRFVLEEIELTLQRDTISDGDVWRGINARGDQEAPFTEQETHEGAIAATQEPAQDPSDGALSNGIALKYALSSSYPETTHSISDDEDWPPEGAFSEDDPEASMPGDLFYDQTNHSPRAIFSPRDVVIGAVAALFGVAVAAAAFAPVALSTRGQNATNETLTPATIASVQAIGAPEIAQAQQEAQTAPAGADQSAPINTQTATELADQEIEDIAVEPVELVLTPAEETDELAADGRAGAELEQESETLAIDGAAIELRSTETSANGEDLDSVVEEPTPADEVAALLSSISASIDEGEPIQSEDQPDDQAEQVAYTETLDEIVIASIEPSAPTSEDRATEVEISDQTYLGSYFRDCLECPDMATLPVGAFDMGAPPSEQARIAAEGPITRVTFAQPFAIGTREVTFEQWDACVADGGCRAYTPPGPWGRGKQPVVGVSFEDATSYAAWLSEKTGWRYRLPSEAEWEYAARAGKQSPFSFGHKLSTSIANYNGNFPYGGAKGVNRKKPTKVGSFAPNAFGLFDLHGNVWEWTEDCWSANHASAPTNGGAVAGDCASRVLKGGAYNTGGWRLRAAHRIAKNQAAREADNGFRVLREMP